MSGFWHRLGAAPAEHGFGVNATVDLEVWQLGTVDQLHPGNSRSQLGECETQFILVIMH